MENEIKSFPELRFEEFFGEWEYNKLGSISDVYDGTHQTPKYVKGGVKFVSVENIYDLGKTNKFITKEAFEKDFKIKPQKDDILMTRITAGIIGATSIVKNNDPLAYYVSLALIRKKTNIDVAFLNHRINSNLFKHELHKRIIHVAFPKKINLNEINNCVISYPQPEEQQKIASFLTAADKKIEQLTRKKELLEQYKKGVMQKIFSQEIRFKDDNGQNYPDWEEKRLGDVISFHPTNSLSRSDLNYETGNIYNIHYGDIHKSFKTNFDMNFEIVPYINHDIKVDRIKAESFCKIGDIIIADASEDYADIGKAIEVWNLSDKKVVAGLHTFLGRDKNAESSTGFKGYLFKTDSIRKQIYRIAQGISVLGISKKNLSGIKFKQPHRDEQLKIVTFLSLIDNKINTVQTQIIQTQYFKKGLLQKMFV